MRYSSVACTAEVPRRFRRRLGFFVWQRCRRPALARSTLPPAVILNRLAADFFVLMPFGRRIYISFLSKRARNIWAAPRSIKRYFQISRHRSGAHQTPENRRSRVNEALISTTDRGFPNSEARYLTVPAGTFENSPAVSTLGVRHPTTPSVPHGTAELDSFPWFRSFGPSVLPGA